MRLLKIFRRPADFVIGGAERPYLFRWFVIPRNRWFNIYLHKIVRSDDDRALHCHPWWNLSVILHGAYVEITERAWTFRRSGSVVFRLATQRHRLALAQMNGQEQACWTLFFTGPRFREWGFYCGDRFVHWTDFTAGTNGEVVGRGCGETNDASR